MSKLRIEEVAHESEWENFIGTYCPQALFQSYAWGNVQQKLGNTVWRFGYHDKNFLVAVAQIQKVHARRGTFLHIRHGPVAIQPGIEIYKQILLHARQLAQKENALFIRISPLLIKTAAHQQLFSSLGCIPAAIHAMDAETTLVLDISKPEEELLAGMRKSTRYEIRRAQKSSVIVHTRDNPDDLDTFFRLYTETSKRQSFVKHTGIREEFEEFAKRKSALMFTAEYKGKISAAAIILYYNGYAIYHHGASEKTDIPVTHVLQWESIRHARSIGMKYYNFWGISESDNPAHPWYGITVFKKGFGGTIQECIHAQDYPISLFYGATRIIETARRMKRGY